MPLHLPYSLHRYAEDKCFSQYVYPGWQCEDLVYAINSLYYIPHGQTNTTVINVSSIWKRVLIHIMIGTIPVSYFCGWQKFENYRE